MIKKYLTFDELSLRWKCERDDIHHLIESGDLVPSISWTGYVIECKCEVNTEGGSKFLLTRISDGVDGYVKQNISNRIYLRNPKPCGPNRYFFSDATIEALPKNENYSSCSWYQLIQEIHHNFKASIQPESIESDAIFMLEKVEWCESLNPDLLVESESNYIFDQNDPKYPSELDVAVKAWQAVSKSGSKKKAKAQIKVWLNTNAKELSNAAKDRISMVANWDKLGGATRTD